MLRLGIAVSKVLWTAAGGARLSSLMCRVRRPLTRRNDGRLGQRSRRRSGTVHAPNTEWNRRAYSMVMRHLSSSPNNVSQCSSLSRLGLGAYNDQESASAHQGHAPGFMQVIRKARTQGMTHARVTCISSGTAKLVSCEHHGAPLMAWMSATRMRQDGSVPPSLYGSAGRMLAAVCEEHTVFTFVEVA